MNCKFCSQSDESRLALSSRLVNGKVIHEWVCLDCLFVDMFRTLGKYGNALSEKENRKRILEEREPSGPHERADL